MEAFMMICSFDKLVRYLDRQLDLDSRLELLEHLDECETCREAIYQISRDRDAQFFVYRPYDSDKAVTL
jgi:anti-sigma factor RsiW